MIELKPLKKEAVKLALEKAKRYRLLDEPDEAESICLDVLATLPGYQEALITLILSLTDKFGQSRLFPAFNQAQELVAQLDDNFSKAYYLGVIFERRAKFHLRQGGPGSGTAAHEWFAKAMEEFAKALHDDDPKSQEAVLRWNSCARIMNANPEIKAEDPQSSEMLLDTYETPH